MAGGPRFLPGRLLPADDATLQDQTGPAQVPRVRQRVAVDDEEVRSEAFPHRADPVVDPSTAAAVEVAAAIASPVGTPASPSQRSSLSSASKGVSRHPAS